MHYFVTTPILGEARATTRSKFHHKQSSNIYVLTLLHSGRIVQSAHIPLFDHAFVLLAQPQYIALHAKWTILADDTLVYVCSA